MLINSEFKPAWWVKNRHLQTIWAAVLRRPIKLPVPSRKRIELGDGDFIDVDAFLGNQGPVVLMLHGLEGSLDSLYMQGTVKALLAQDFQVVVKYFRGCSGESNRLARSYHSGVSDDLQDVITQLAENQINVEYLVGFSLGGNVTLKWLGENHQNHQVKGAVAVSVPLLLDECANSIDQGFSKIYSARLLGSLKQKALQKHKEHSELKSLTPEQIKNLNTFWQFDHEVTAPLNGFDGAQDYYAKVSGQQYLAHIRIPTLVIHAKDDPFMNTAVVPQADQLAEKVTFELSDNGGHVGFVSGDWPWNPEYYLEQRIPEYLNNLQKQ